MHDHTAQRHIDPWLASLAVLVIAAVLAAGCGGESGGTSSTTNPRSAAQEAQLKYAQCMREQGIDIPDPTFESGGPAVQKGPPEGVPEEKLRAADQACEKHGSNSEPPALSEEQQQELKEAVLAHARCMREQGIEDFPDPTFDENGEARIPKGASIDRDDPDFQAAQRACRDKRPQNPSEQVTP